MARDGASHRLWVGLAATACFAVLAGAADRNRTARADAALRKRLRPAITPNGRRAALAVSTLGYPGVYLPGSLLLARWLRRRGIKGGETIVAAAVASWATQRLVKLLVRRERPPSQKGTAQEFQAFPSGHTTAATAVVLAIAEVFDREKILPGSIVLPVTLALPMAIGVSRMYIDKHWASDVVGGWLAGAGIATLSQEATKLAARV